MVKRISRDFKKKETSKVIKNEKKINKFVCKGNLEDYETLFNNHEKQKHKNQSKNH